MGIRCARGVAVAVLLACGLLAGAADDKEVKGLKGRWVSEKFVWAGRGSEEGEKMTLVIGDDSISWQYVKRMGNQAKSSGNTYTYKLDPSKKPAEIHLTITDGVFKGKTFPSIYHLDGDTLKLCRNQPGQKRPTEFASKKGSDTIFLVLKRGHEER
jgi:uncharacterized protein (TIGR03067 family)